MKKMATEIKGKETENMTDENRQILARINSFAENMLGEIDPQKVPVSQQLEKLKPIMEEIAKEKGLNMEEVFILYMDLQSEATCSAQKKLEDSLIDLNDGSDGEMPLLFR